MKSRLAASPNLSALPILVLDVVKRRRLSQLIAVKLALHHESPQLILIWQKEAVWAEDHLEIDPAEAWAEWQNLQHADT